MRILVTGASGMLGSDLVEELSGKHEVMGLSQEELDVTERGRVVETVKTSSPDLIIHCAAYTDVDRCESEPERAYRVNGLGARNVAQACAEKGATMVYISTDYLFDGKKGTPYIEIDPPNPLNVYGMSKLMGEDYVKNLLNQHYIVRTSWLFGRKGKNFVKTILNLALNRRGEGTLRVVDDQVGSPTYTADLAKKISELIEKGGFGTYHITNSGYCSWFDLCRKILELTGITNVEVQAIKSWESGRPAKRPIFSALDNMMLRLEGIPLLRGWEEALEEYLVMEGVKKVADG